MKMRKILAMVMALALTAALTVGGTLAYLTSQDSVTNTFTVGKVAITLDEQDVDNSTADADRDKANTYSNLMPGHKYVKDPIVHVNADSESSWIFVEVKNGLSAFEADTSNVSGSEYTKIADQVTGHGWTALNGVANVYYQSYTKGQTDKDLEVFDEFKISGTANDVSGWSEITTTNTDTQIVVTAYAVQADGFATANEAWTATFGASTQG